MCRAMQPYDKGIDLPRRPRTIVGLEQQPRNFERTLEVKEIGHKEEHELMGKLVISPKEPVRLEAKVPQRVKVGHARFTATHFKA